MGRTLPILMLAILWGSLIPLAAQDIYTDEDATPPPMSSEVPLAKSKARPATDASASASAAAEAAAAEARAQTQADARQDYQDSYEQESPTMLAPPSYAEPEERVESAPVRTQGSSLYDELEGIYGKEMKSSDESRSQSRKSTARDSRREDPRARKTPDKKRGKAVVYEEGEENFGEAPRWALGVNAEYANQFSHEQSHGYGAGFQALYKMSPQLSVGGALLWNRFSESVEYTDIKVEVSRTAQHYLLGPMLRFAPADFAFDAVLGWDRISSNFKIKDQVTGQSLNSALGTSGGKFSDNSAGLALRAAYSLPLEENFSLDFYLSYAIGFYFGDNLNKEKKSRIPQQIGVGVLTWFKL
jgi:hypothetical protein